MHWTLGGPWFKKGQKLSTLDKEWFLARDEAMIFNMYVVIAVPARLESSRLPNKVLCDIGGKPMIQRVLEQCSLSKSSDNLFLCCDDESLLKKAEELGI